VQRAFFDYYRADREYRIHLEHVELATHIVELARQNYQTGRATQQDVLRAYRRAHDGHAGRPECASEARTELHVVIADNLWRAVHCGVRHHRRKVVYFNVTDSPTAAWTAQQVVEAFPDDSAPRYILRDRDSIYGGEFRRRLKGMRIAEVVTAPLSPWQNPFAERVIGTIRRELLDHVIVLNEGHLRRRLHSYFRYYHGSRTHLALEKDAPEPRAVELPEHGSIVALPQVGGLHHRYVRRATKPPSITLSLRRKRSERYWRSRDGFAPAPPSTRADVPLGGSRHMIGNRRHPIAAKIGTADRAFPGSNRRDRVLANDRFS